MKGVSTRLKRKLTRREWQLLVDYCIAGATVRKGSRGMREEREKLRTLLEKLEPQPHAPYYKPPTPVEL